MASCGSAVRSELKTLRFYMGSLEKQMALDEAELRAGQDL